MKIIANPNSYDELQYLSEPSDGEFSSYFLKLDQTTPQTITGDTPKLDTLKSKTILGTDTDGKIIEGTHQSLAGLVPYTGATGAVDLGSQNLLTTGSLGAGAITGKSVLASQRQLVRKTETRKLLTENENVINEKIKEVIELAVETGIGVDTPVDSK